MALPLVVEWLVRIRLMVHYRWSAVLILWCGVVAGIAWSPALHAQEITAAMPAVEVWLTEVEQGDQKDARLGSLPADAPRFNTRQDDDYHLLSRGQLQFQQRATPATPWQIKIDPQAKGHQLQGVGAAMTDSAAFVLSQLKQHNPSLYEYTMQKLFSPTEGAHFSYLRRPIGSSDYTATAANYTYCDRQADGLDGFSIAHDTEYIIPMLKEARRINPQLQIMGTPWSPPAWMKTNQDLFGISETQKAAGATNRLKPDAFPLYADYLVRFCRAYAEQGVVVNAITMQNEPQFDAAQYPCMRMTVDDQIGLLKQLGPKLRAAGLDTEIYVHDHNWVLHPNDLRVIGGDKKQQPLEVVQQILADPEVAQYVAGSAWHCYSGNAADMRRVYGRLRAQFPDKRIYCTEATGWGKNRGLWWGDVNWGLQHNWLGGLAAGSSLALQWNLALDHKFGPTLRKDSAALGLVTINTDTWQDVRFEREYYAMAQVSLAVQPGSCVLKHQVTGQQVTVHQVTGQQSATSDNPLDVLAVRQADGSFAAIVVNTSLDTVPLSIECEERAFTYRLPQHSIATFRWK